MKIKLVFLEKEEKIAKNNRPYVRYNTSDGKWYTCFDTKVMEFLNSVVGKDNVVECEVDGNVIKWTEFMTINPAVENIGKAVDSNFKLIDKNNTMYVSYAKDIFIAALHSDRPEEKLEDTMNRAINLVKQAKEAFK